MARLKSLKPVVSSLKPRISYLKVDYDQTRRERYDWRKWYGLARWKALRLRVLERDGFTCQDCGRMDHDTSRLHADHKRAHRGDPSLFWDEQNVQCLCERCHNGAKQRAERGGRV